MTHLILCFFCILNFAILSASEHIQKEIESCSEHLGYESGIDLQGINGYYDLDAVIRGLKKAENDDKQKSLNSKEEKREIIAEIQNSLFEKKSFENLAHAEKFLNDLSKNINTNEIIEKKLYMQVLKQGSGTKEITSNSNAIFRYKILIMDGSVLINEVNEETSKLSVDTAIPGFQKGTIGMKQGEQRKLYIHPDLAYRKTGMFPPNSLIIVDVEVVALE